MSQWSILLSDADELFVHLDGPFEFCDLLLFKMKFTLMSLRARTQILKLFGKLFKHVTLK